MLITKSHVKGNNIAMYYRGTANSAEGRISLYILVAAPNEHTQKKGGKNKPI